MGVRIKDIAQSAGVSPATVSLALNNKPGVGDDVRERVTRLAADLGYKGPKTHSAVGTTPVCLLHISRHGHTVNQDHDVFIADYIEGLGQGARQHGLSLEIVTFRATPIERIVSAARGHPAEGFVVLGTELDAADVQAFTAVSKPIAFLDTYHEFIPFDFVDMNNEDAAFMIVAYLAAAGHRRIGMVKGAIETRNIRLREEGFRASMARRGLPVEQRHCFTVDQTFHGAYADMAALLAAGIDLPTALFCANDIIACGCLRAFREAGVRVPDDLSLIGFDDLPLAAVADPPLTTIQVSKVHIGRMAVQLLAMRIRSRSPMPPVKVLIGGDLIERRSVRRLDAPTGKEGTP
jgi:DNA-binding LacI/PurR family transcriptional regulator